MVGVNSVSLRNHMYLNRITGIEMAEKLGISQSSFYKKINRKRDFTATEMSLMANILKINVNDLYL